MVHALDLRANLSCVYRELIERMIFEAGTSQLYSGAPDGSAFDGNAIFSVSCRDGVSFPSVSTCSELTFSFVAVVRDAITATSFARAVITCKAVPRSGTARDGCRVSVFPRGTVKLLGVFTCYMAGGTCHCVSGSVRS